MCQFLDVTIDTNYGKQEDLTGCQFLYATIDSKVWKQVLNENVTVCHFF